MAGKWFRWFAPVLLLVAGCAPPEYLYKPNPAMQAVSEKRIRIAVAPFHDYSVSDDSGNCLWLLPLVLWSNTGTKNGPPRFFQHVDSQGDLIDPKDYADCLAEDLDAAGLFVSVDYVPWDQLAKKRDDYDLIITGDLNYDRFKSFWITYGLSALPAGFLECGLPIFPSGFFTRELSLTCYAFLPKEPLKHIWTFNVHEKGSTRCGVSYLGIPGLSNSSSGTGPEVIFKNPASPDLLRSAFLDVRQDLRQQIEPGGDISKALHLSQNAD